MATKPKTPLEKPASKTASKGGSDKKSPIKDSKSPGGGETPIHTVRVPDSRWEAAKRVTKGSPDGVSGVINQALRKKTGK